MKGLVGGAAQGSAGCCRNWTTELEHWNSSHRRGVCRCGPNRLGWRAIQTGAERQEGASSKQNRHRFVPHIKLSPMSAPGPIGERQEHLDAIVSFAGAGQTSRQKNAASCSTRS